MGRSAAWPGKIADVLGVGRGCTIEQLAIGPNGAGTARLKVANSVIFNPERQCDLDVTFAYVRANDAWVLSGLNAAVAVAERAPTPAAPPITGAPPDGCLVAAIGPDGAPLPATRASVVDTARTTRPDGDGLQIMRRPFYPVDKDAPVVPLGELRAAPRTGPARQILVRDGGYAGKGPGWVAAPLAEAGEGGAARSLTWQTGAFYQSRPDLVAAKEVAFVGVTSWAWWEIAGSGLEWQAFTTYKKVAELVVAKNVDQGWDLAALPSDGAWALVDARGPYPWQIYLVNAGPEPSDLGD